MSTAARSIIRFAGREQQFVDIVRHAGTLAGFKFTQNLIEIV
ncbi:hypothetical protein X742_31070 [Mesorhizobium sp. LNHC232B00]|nr:hypothetical protein X742_31070 [Mesorhizobium sp. LNHC232B00]